MRYSPFFIALIFLILTACSDSMPKILEVPVGVQCPSPTIQKKPHLPIEDLKVGAKPNVTIKAYVESVKILQDDDNELRTLLSAYKQ